LQCIVGFPYLVLIFVQLPEFMQQRKLLLNGFIEMLRSEARRAERPAKALISRHGFLLNR
jgi:hypothetical protein